MPDLSRPILVSVCALLAAFCAAVSVSEAATLTVNKRADDADLSPGDGGCDAKPRQGPQCTLRAAIEEANALGGEDTVKFDVGGEDEVQTISPATSLPEISGRLKINGYSQSGAAPNTQSSGNNAVLRIELDGSLAPGAKGLRVISDKSIIRGMVVNEFAVGIDVREGDRSKLLGNFIGTNADGTVGDGNATNIRISDFSSGNVIGGTSPANRNLISAAFEHGIELFDSSGNLIRNNYIGTDRTGAVDLGNATNGILFRGDSQGNEIGGEESGSGNVIAFTSGYGVNVRDGLSYQNAILGNSIHGNGLMGINLGFPEGITANDLDDPDSGANLEQNHPLITDADEVLPGGINIDGTLNSNPSSAFTIQFFSNPTDEAIDEGKRFLGETSVTTDVGGDAAFSTTLQVPGLAGHYVTATATNSTATNSTGNTSEFSSARIVDPATIGPR